MCQFVVITLGRTCAVTRAGWDCYFAQFPLLLRMGRNGQKWEETLSRVPAGKAVELTNYMGNVGFSSEMVGEDI